MASRPVFIPLETQLLVCEKTLDFKWHSGFAVSQKQKSIFELHQAILSNNVGNKPLEVSSKSEESLGVSLSAFNLKVTLRSGKQVALENIFQASKIFKHGGPYKDLLQVTPLEAKRDPRLKESGDMIGFQGKDGIWPLEPKTLFYDWLYINALHKHPDFAEAVMEFDSFTDIEFNPTKSFNCQAHSVALYVALAKNGELKQVLADSSYYCKLMSEGKSTSTQNNKPVQQSLI
ncbi:DarT1-associated NADAR antitoxin family protein [Vibrio campbellii]